MCEKWLNTSTRVHSKEGGVKGERRRVKRQPQPGLQDCPTGCGDRRDRSTTVLPRSIEDGVFSPGLVCLRYPGLDPRVCLGYPVFLNGDEIPGSSLLTGPLNLRAQSLTWYKPSLLKKEVANTY